MKVFLVKPKFVTRCFFFCSWPVWYPLQGCTLLAMGVIETKPKSEKSGEKGPLKLGANRNQWVYMQRYGSKCHKSFLPTNPSPVSRNSNWGLWNKHPPGKQIGSPKILVFFPYGGQLVHLSASYVAGTRICLLGVLDYIIHHYSI